MDEQSETTFLKKITLFDIKIVLASLIIPSVILPVIYSSIILIPLSLFTVYNIFFASKKHKINKKNILPFLFFYVPVVIACVIDAYYGVFKIKYIFKNLIVLVIPLFIFSSNFKKNDLNRILIIKSYIISTFGIIMLLLWFLGYQNYKNLNQFEQLEWNLNEISLVKNDHTKNELINLKISNKAKNPNFRRGINVSSLQTNDSIIRKLQIKKTDQDCWITIKTYDFGDNKGAWFNVKNGEIGFVEEGIYAKSKLLNNGYYDFSVTNILDKGAKKEWFHVKFVSKNKSNFLGENFLNKDLNINLYPPNFTSASGKNLIQVPGLIHYEITQFTFLENRTHKAYTGLAFLFSFIILFLYSNYPPLIKNIFLVINIIVIITLSSKAATLSLLLLLIIFIKKIFIRYKYILALPLIGVFFIKDMYIYRRFQDMFQTIIKISSNENLNQLGALSTNSRLTNYKDYIYLIKENIWGYGFVNGKNTFNGLYEAYLNSHNQFIQILFDSGITGFMFFLIFSSIFFYKSYYKEILIFIIIIYFNCFFESIFARQWGLIIISFASSVYICGVKKNKWFQ